MSDTTTRGGVPGESARKPTEVPKKGWLQIAKRAWKESKEDHVPLLAAGVAFYAFLSIFPALIAAITLYGLFADPQQAVRQVEQVASALPSAARELLTTQVEQLTSAQPAGLGLAAIASILVAFWSASNGVGNMMTAINIAYDEEDRRGFIKQKALALLLTIGAIVFVVVAVALIAVAPVVLDVLGLGALATVLIQIARWALLVVAVMVALAVLYRLAPQRDAPQMRWVSVGAVIATVLWILASVGFSLYVSLGGYGESYGALAGVVVLLFWLWISSYAILLGAEANAEAEQQTAKDTTRGPERPIGERDAVKADSMPGDVDVRSAEARQQRS
jgi:membrane protein